MTVDCGQIYPATLLLDQYWPNRISEYPPGGTRVSSKITAEFNGIISIPPEISCGIPLNTEFRTIRIPPE